MDTRAVLCQHVSINTPTSRKGRLRKAFTEYKYKEVVSLAVRSTPVAWKPEVGAAHALEPLAATGGHVDHPLLPVCRAVRRSPVSLL